MSLATLPSELLAAIFEPLAAASLAALAKSCSSLTAVANRQLYRHLSLSSHAQNLSAVQSLANNTSLASLVRTFAISVHDSDINITEYYVLLGKVLQDMTELTSLELLVGSDASWVLPTTPTSLYPRLQHLTTSFIFDVNVASFLSRTPHLLSLQLSSTFAAPDAMDLPSSVVPKLASYTGPASLLPVLLSSSRPLSTLHLSGELTLPIIDYLASLGRDQTGSDVRSADNGCELGKPRIEVLSAITSTPPVTVLEALGKACPTLVCLRVMTTCAFWEAPDLVCSSFVVFLVTRTYGIPPSLH